MVALRAAAQKTGTVHDVCRNCLSEQCGCRLVALRFIRIRSSRALQSSTYSRRLRRRTNRATLRRRLRDYGMHSMA